MAFTSAVNSKQVRLHVRKCFWGVGVGGFVMAFRRELDLCSVCRGTKPHPEIKNTKPTENPSFPQAEIFISCRFGRFFSD